MRTLDALRRSRLAEPPPPAALAELTASLAAEAARLRPPAAGGRGGAWRVPLLETPAVEAWLLGWPAGQVTPAHGHGHGRSVVALTVVDGELSEECLDPTIWTTCRRTTWRAGSTTVFPPGHVHVLGAGRGPAAAVHAWSPLGTGPAGRGATASPCQIDRGTPRGSPDPSGPSRYPAAVQDSGRWAVALRVPAVVVAVASFPPLGLLAVAPGRRSILRTVRWMSGTSGMGYPADQPAV